MALRVSREGTDPELGVDREWGVWAYREKSAGLTSKTEGQEQPARQ